MLQESNLLQEKSPDALAADNLPKAAWPPTDAPSEPPGYELKFLIDETRAEDVIAWARKNLRCDPHVDPSLGDAYRILSLYFDTPALDAFHRQRPFRRSRYRMRRYGAETVFYLERKRKAGDRVQKQRTQIRTADLAPGQDKNAPLEWPGLSLVQQFHARVLKPLCQVSYERAAYVGGSPEDSVRLTLDRHLRCAPIAAGTLQNLAKPRGLLPGKRILELKYRGQLPALFKRAMSELDLYPKPISKYRLGVGAWNLGAV